tara:strand:- start:24 stop:368 length:345 start_codon:yes stop_codon:yes gene_type:complete
MSAELVDLSITQGDTFSIRLEVRKPDGSANDLTGYGVRGYLKNKYSDATPLLDLSPTVYNAVGGQIDVFVSSATTAALPITEGIYDIEKYLLNDTTVVDKILTGKILIHPEATV